MPRLCAGLLVLLPSRFRKEGLLALAAAIVDLLVVDGSNMHPQIVGTLVRFDTLVTLERPLVFVCADGMIFECRRRDEGFVADFAIKAAQFALSARR